MVNPGTLRDEFVAEGYVVIRGFLSGGQLAMLREQLERYIREVVPGLGGGDAFYEDRSRPETLKQLHRIEQDAFFAGYLGHSLWRHTAEALLGEPVRSPQGAEWFNKPPATAHATPPHQDNFYFCLAPPQVLTMWLALDDVDEENGCLRYVPGSHKRGIRPHTRTSTLGFSQGIADYDKEDRRQEVAVPAEPGDVLIHHGNTIHRADANRSLVRHRRSFGMVFQGQSSVRDELAFERYLQSSRQQHQELGVTGR
ncbi:MAG: phytanoyl-CoA dioxygenase family protein [Planctomycetota bacterium]